MRRFVLCLSFVIIILTIIISNIVAQTSKVSSKDSAVQTGEIKPAGYPVVLGNQTLYFIKEVKGLSAQERAKTQSERLKQIAENTSIQTNTINVSDYKHPLTLVSADYKLLLTVLSEDAKLENKTRQELANERAAIVRSAIEKYRHDYSRKQLLFGSLYAILTTMACLALLYLLVKLYRHVIGKIGVWADTKIRQTHLKSLKLVRAERVKSILLSSAKALRFIIFAVIVYNYVHLVLGFFPWTKPLANRLLTYIMVPLGVMGEAIWREFPNIIFVAIIALFTILALKITRFMFRGLENETITIHGFYPEWSQSTYKIFRILIIAFAAIVAFPYIPGSRSAAFKGISIFLGVLFSLGSTSAVANILAGYSLIYRRVFKVGDRVKIADFVGDVVEMRLQVVSLETIKNELVVVPSSMVVNSHVINYSALAKEKGLILHTKVTIGYDTPWRQVEALLLLAAGRTEGILRHPEPFILQTSLDDYYATYELNVYTDRPENMADVYAELHQNIQDAFNEYEVQIMSPAYRGDPSKPKVVPKDQWYAAPARKPGGQDEPGV